VSKHVVVDMSYMVYHRVHVLDCVTTESHLTLQTVNLLVADV
jgi:hypothetical protein